ncbi:hypothetical protein JE010_23500 [Pseudomonas aeruginosa]|uniref:TnsA endonuclease N-terminal domain-containing protein n=2 Tax=Pseudomonas aeruginosa TaxID=287 RepID=UPI00046624A4|nr:TnsA endonuclease N-terminal domain-containing protein [Pseudomonas aeruginosa]MBI8970379.1 hypothetical protein [Pseudomonas aeruginosa]WCY23500.1 hypothetical protein KK186_00060 [Pseudomonas aeruginosa]HBO5728510.1 hypothetical protein [Pseudomonas aeruginosa]
MINDGKSSGGVRDVTRRVHRGRRALAFFSQKNADTEVRVESGLELDVGMLLEADPRVLSYSAQPFFLELETGKLFDQRAEFPKNLGIKPRWYTPDFLCRMQDGSQLAIDAKHSSFHEKFAQRSPEITESLRQLGIGFCVIANDAVEATVCLNLRTLHGLRAPCHRDFVMTATAEIEQQLLLATTWRSVELETRLSGARPAVLAGLLNGLLRADLRCPLFEPASVVTASYGDLSHFIHLELPHGI